MSSHPSWYNTDSDRPEFYGNRQHYRSSQASTNLLEEYWLNGELNENFKYSPDFNVSTTTHGYSQAYTQKIGGVTTAVSETDEVVEDEDGNTFHQRYKTYRKDVNVTSSRKFQFNGTEDNFFGRSWVYSEEDQSGLLYVVRGEVDSNGYGSVVSTLRSSKSIQDLTYTRSVWSVTFSSEETRTANTDASTFFSKIMESTFTRLYIEQGWAEETRTSTQSTSITVSKSVPKEFYTEETPSYSDDLSTRIRFAYRTRIDTKKDETIFSSTITPRFIETSIETRTFASNIGKSVTYRNTGISAVPYEYRYDMRWLYPLSTEVSHRTFESYYRVTTINKVRNTSGLPSSHKSYLVDHTIENTQSSFVSDVYLGETSSQTDVTSTQTNVESVVSTVTCDRYSQVIAINGYGTYEGTRGGLIVLGDIDSIVYNTEKNRLEKQFFRTVEYVRKDDRDISKTRGDSTDDDVGVADKTYHTIDYLTETTTSSIYGVNTEEDKSSRTFITSDAPFYYNANARVTDWYDRTGDAYFYPDNTDETFTYITGIETIKTEGADGQLKDYTYTTENTYSFHFEAFTYDKYIRNAVVRFGENSFKPLLSMASLHMAGQSIRNHFITTQTTTFVVTLPIQATQELFDEETVTLCSIEHTFNKSNRIYFTTTEVTSEDTAYYPKVETVEYSSSRDAGKWGTLKYEQSYIYSGVVSTTVANRDLQGIKDFTTEAHGYFGNNDVYFNFNETLPKYSLVFANTYVETHRYVQGMQTLNKGFDNESNKKIIMTNEGRKISGSRFDIGLNSLTYVYTFTSTFPTTYSRFTSKKVFTTQEPFTRTATKEAPESDTDDSVKTETIFTRSYIQRGYDYTYTDYQSSLTVYTHKLPLNKSFIFVGGKSFTSRSQRWGNPIWNTFDLNQYSRIEEATVYKWDDDKSGNQNITDNYFKLSSAKITLTSSTIGSCNEKVEATLWDLDLSKKAGVVTAQISNLNLSWEYKQAVKYTDQVFPEKNPLTKTEFWTYRKWAFYDETYTTGGNVVFGHSANPVFNLGLGWRASDIDIGDFDETNTDDEVIGYPEFAFKNYKPIYIETASEVIDYTDASTFELSHISLTNVEDSIPLTIKYMDYIWETITRTGSENKALTSQVTGPLILREVPPVYVTYDSTEYDGGNYVSDSPHAPFKLSNFNETDKRGIPINPNY